MNGKLWVLFLITTNTAVAIFNFFRGNMWASGFSSACAIIILIIYLMESYDHR